MGEKIFLYLFVYLQCNIFTLDNFLFPLNNEVLLQSISHIFQKGGYSISLSCLLFLYIN